MFQNVLIFTIGPQYRKIGNKKKIDDLNLDKKFLTRFITIKKVFVRTLIYLNKSIMKKLFQIMLISA